MLLSYLERRRAAARDPVADLRRGLAVSRGEAIAANALAERVDKLAAIATLAASADAPPAYAAPTAPESVGVPVQAVVETETQAQALRRQIADVRTSLDELHERVGAERRAAEATYAAPLHNAPASVGVTQISVDPKAPTILTGEQLTKLCALRCVNKRPLAAGWEAAVMPHLAAHGLGVRPAVGGAASTYEAFALPSAAELIVDALEEASAAPGASVWV